MITQRVRAILKLALTLAALGCGQTTTPADAGPILCTQNQDCPGADQSLEQCGYDVKAGCSAMKQCFHSCPPTAPDRACSCSGTNVNVCYYAFEPIAHLGTCDGGP